MKCPACGNSVNESAKFCTTCGNTITRTYNPPPTANDSASAGIFNKALILVLLVIVLVLVSALAYILIGFSSAKENSAVKEAAFPAAESKPSEAKSSETKPSEPELEAPLENAVDEAVDEGAASAPVSILVTRMDISSFPKLVVYFDISDREGKPINEIAKNFITLNERNADQPIEELMLIDASSFGVTYVTNISKSDSGPRNIMLEFNSGKYSGTAFTSYTVTNESISNGPAIQPQLTTSNYYILPDSAIRYISSDELRNFSKDQLALARNEIYARHGYVFSADKYKTYFASQSWYTPNPNYGGGDDTLNIYEKQNVKTIKELE